jgi:hypothetical protein
LRPADTAAAAPPCTGGQRPPRWRLRRRGGAAGPRSRVVPTAAALALALAAAAPAAPTATIATHPGPGLNCPSPTRLVGWAASAATSGAGLPHVGLHRQLCAGRAVSGECLSTVAALLVAPAGSTAAPQQQQHSAPQQAGSSTRPSPSPAPSYSCLRKFPTSITARHSHITALQHCLLSAYMIYGGRTVFWRHMLISHQGHE